MKRKKLCIVTGSRAEWGIFYPLACEIKKNKKDFALSIVASGSHLSSKHGLTRREIEKDGFRADRLVRLSAGDGDSPEDILQSVAAGITGFSRAFTDIKPDIIFLLGDRFETFSAATAAYFLKITVAHLHGGERTEGSLDENLRHAITKLSGIHFVSAEAYRKRVIKMGESPESVFNVGALGLDNLRKTEVLKKEDFEKKINFRLGRKNLIIAFNPPTAETPEKALRELKDLLSAASELADTKIILTKPVCDMYSGRIADFMDSYFSRNRHKVRIFESMGRVLFLNALRHADAVAGNSSSAIIEAPSFGIPTLNVGRRQSGRIKADSVIDCDGSAISIRKGLKKAFSEEFRSFCKSVKNPYGSGKTAGKIIEIVKAMPADPSKKRFFEGVKIGDLK